MNAKRTIRIQNDVGSLTLRINVLEHSASGVVSLGPEMELSYLPGADQADLLAAVQVLALAAAERETRPSTTEPLPDGEWDLDTLAQISVVGVRPFVGALEARTAVAVAVSVAAKV